jgi:hypothetical protein
MNRIKQLILAGIIAIPFYEMFLKLLPYSQSIALDTRIAKSFVAIGFALVIGLFGLNVVRPKTRNRTILGFLLYGYLASHVGARPSLFMNNVNATQFWMWKPLFMGLCFYLMFLVLSNLEYNRTEIDKIIRVSVWCGFIMAAHVFLQYLKVDQSFYVLKEGQQYEGVTNRHLTGNMGQPTLVSPFLAMCVPLALAVNKKIIAGLLAVVVVLVNSVTATVGMVAGVLAMGCVKNKWFALALAVTLLAGLMCLPLFDIDFNGRLGVWTNLINDWRGSPVLGIDANFGFLGTGIGSFAFFFPNKNNVAFIQAHNEYLQILYSMGIVGLMFLLTSIWQVLKRAYDKQGSLYLHGLVGSLVCLCVCAIGTFVWQLAVYQYMTVLIIGLIYNSVWEDVK